MNYTHKSKYPLFSVIAFLLTLIINYGSAFGWFGATQEEISNLYRNFITPEPFTFSIWGIIYLLVLLFLIQTFRRPSYHAPVMDRLHLYFILSLIFNSLWNITWTQNWIGVSTLFIFAFTFVLTLINQWIYNHRSFFKVHLIETITFSVYLGWLTVASITNVAAFLVKINWNMFGLPEHLWACLTYIGIALLAGWILWQIRNPLFNLPIIWAMIGIIAMLLNNPPSQPIHSGMPYVAGAVIVVLIIQAIWIWRDNQWKLLP